MTRTTFFGYGLAIALSAVACGNRSDRTATAGDENRTGQPPASGAAAAGTTANKAAADENASPVALTGCLQKGDGRSDYILTEVNSPRTSVGTSGTTGSAKDRGAGGSAPSGDAVGPEQMRAAAHAYRLNGDRDSLEPLVGRQVRVSGTMAKASDLNAHDDNGRMKDRDRTKIDEGDLAKIDVASVDSVADNCGGKTGRK